MADQKGVELREVKSTIRALLIARAEPVSFDDLLSDYQKQLGKPLEYWRFGWNTPFQFAVNLTDAVEVVGHELGFKLKPIILEDTKHLVQLVTRQRKAPARRAPAPRRSHYGFNYHTPGSRKYQSSSPKRHMSPVVKTPLYHQGISDIASSTEADFRPSKSDLLSENLQAPRPASGPLVSLSNKDDAGKPETGVNATDIQPLTSQPPFQCLQATKPTLEGASEGASAVTMTRSIRPPTDAPPDIRPYDSQLPECQRAARPALGPTENSTKYEPTKPNTGARSDIQSTCFKPLHQWYEAGRSVSEHADPPSTKVDTACCESTAIMNLQTSDSNSAFPQAKSPALQRANTLSTKVESCRTDVGTATVLQLPDIEPSCKFRQARPPSIPADSPPSTDHGAAKFKASTNTDLRSPSSEPVPGCNPLAMPNSGIRDLRFSRPGFQPGPFHPGFHQWAIRPIPSPYPPLLQPPPPYVHPANFNGCYMPNWSMPQLPYVPSYPYAPGSHTYPFWHSSNPYPYAPFTPNAPNGNAIPQWGTAGEDWNRRLLLGDSGATSYVSRRNQQAENHDGSKKENGTGSLALSKPMPEENIVSKVGNVDGPEKENVAVSFNPSQSVPVDAPEKQPQLACLPAGYSDDESKESFYLSPLPSPHDEFIYCDAPPVQPPQCDGAETAQSVPAAQQKPSCGDPTIEDSTSTEAIDGKVAVANTLGLKRSDFEVKIKSILKKYPDGVLIPKFLKEYEEQNSEPLDLVKLGYPSMECMVVENPEIFVFEKLRYSIHMTIWAAGPPTRHHQMVQRGSTSQLQPAPDVQPVCRKRTLDSSMRKSDVLTERLGSRREVPFHVQDYLTALARKYPDGKRIEEFEELFMKKYSTDMSPEKLGFDSIMDVLRECAFISVRERGNVRLLYPKYWIHGTSALETAPPIKSMNLASAPPSSEMPQDKPEHGWRGHFKEHECDPLFKYKPPVISDERLLQVQIVEVQSPGQFWIQFLQDLQSLKDLMCQLSEFYLVEEEKYLLPQEFVLSGLAVAVVFQGTSQWHRARIESSEGDEVEVYYVDYGTTESVKRSDLRKLDKRFGEDPLYAIEASMYGLTSGSDEWPIEAGEFLYKNYCEIPLSARIRERHFDDPKGPSLEVVLFRTDEDGQVVEDINETMLKEQLASSRGASLKVIDKSVPIHM